MRKYFSSKNLKKLFALCSFAVVITTAKAQTNWSISGNTGVSNMFLGTTTQTDLLFKTNLVERLRITAGGFVGIGVVLPTQRLDVNGNLRVRGTLFVDNDIVTNFGQMTSDFLDVGLINVTDITAGNISVDTIKPYVMNMNQLSSIIGTTRFNERVLMNEKLGLGVLNPTEKFELAGGNAKFGGDVLYLGNEGLNIANRTVNGANNLYFGKNIPNTDPDNNICYNAVMAGEVSSNFEQYVNVYCTNGGNGNNANTIKQKLTFGLDSQNGIIELAGNNTVNTSGVSSPPSLLINYKCGKNVYICTGTNGGKVHIGTGSNSNNTFNVSGTSYFNGKVGIGINPNNMTTSTFAVDGIIGARGVNLYDVSVSIPDYVFEKKL